MTQLDGPPLQMPLDEKTRLHLLSEADALPLFRLVQIDRAYLREWMPWLDGTRSVDDMLAFVRSRRIWHLNNEGADYSILYQGRVAGSIGFHQIDWANRKVAIGYWLGSAFQGHGMMTRSCVALINYAFETLKLNKVEIYCATGNLKSRAIPERLHFVQEGMIRQAEWLYDHYVDLVCYGMLASEWQAIQLDKRS